MLQGSQSTSCYSGGRDQKRLRNTGLIDCFQSLVFIKYMFQIHEAYLMVPGGLPFAKTQVATGVFTLEERAATNVGVERLICVVGRTMEGKKNPISIRTMEIRFWFI